VERQEGGEEPSGPRSAWYWLRRAEKKNVAQAIACMQAWRPALRA